MNEKFPLVSIIILSWNNQKLLQNCLKSVYDTNYPNYEIIVVDNGSSDNSPKIVRANYPDVILIENKQNLGFSEGNNRGIRRARGTYIVLLNQDTEVDPNWLKNLITVMINDKQIGIVGCKLYFSQSRRIQHAGGSIGRHAQAKHIGYGQVDTGQYDEIIYPDYVTGAAFMIRRAVLNKIGLLDPIYFMYYEDFDMCYQAKKLGYKVAYVPNSVAYHYESGSWEFRSKQQFYMVHRNRVRFVIKNYESYQVLIWILIEFMFIIRLLGGLAISKRFKYVHELVYAYLWNIKHFRETRN